MKVPAWLVRFFSALHQVPPGGQSYPHPRRGPGCPQGVLEAGDMHSENIEVIDRRTGGRITLVKMVDVDNGVLVRYRTASSPQAIRPKLLYSGVGEPVTETLKGPWGIRLRKACK